MTATIERTESILGFGSLFRKKPISVSLTTETPHSLLTHGAIIEKVENYLVSSRINYDLETLVDYTSFTWYGPKGIYSLSLDQETNEIVFSQHSSKRNIQRKLLEDNFRVSNLHMLLK